MELIDTHAHLTFEELRGDIDAVLTRSLEAGVTSCITVGTSPSENAAAETLAARYERVYATAGIHPHYAKDILPGDLEAIRQFAGGDKVVAIGETGLDFHYNFSRQEAQKRIFAEQLEIARELQLPVVVHSRNAFDETAEILEPFMNELPGAVIHCFTYGAEEARAFLAMGCHISFTGVVTFKSAAEARAAASVVPLERMMLETDCPYMSPEPMRKQKINEPALLTHTAAFLAERKKVELPAFASATTATAKAFFGI